MIPIIPSIGSWTSTDDKIWVWRLVRLTTHISLSLLSLCHTAYQTSRKAVQRTHKIKDIHEGASACPCLFYTAAYHKFHSFNSLHIVRDPTGHWRPVTSVGFPVFTPFGCWWWSHHLSSSPYNHISFCTTVTSTKLINVFYYNNTSPLGSRTGPVLSMKSKGPEYYILNYLHIF